ncbi:MAG: hypothetical protein ACYC7D_10875 [Nitrososphaerales archaeon]
MPLDATAPDTYLWQDAHTFTVPHGVVSNWVLRQEKVSDYRPCIEWSDEASCAECGSALFAGEPHWNISARGTSEVSEAVCESCFENLNDEILDKN